MRVPSIKLFSNGNTERCIIVYYMYENYQLTRKYENKILMT